MFVSDSGGRWLHLIYLEGLYQPKGPKICYYTCLKTEMHTNPASKFLWVAVISAKNHKSQRRKRQSVTAKQEKSQTPKVLTAILTLPNLT